MLKNKLELLTKEFTTLKEKITAKLQQKDNTITETNTKLTESNRKLEELTKENTANEKENLVKERDRARKNELELMEDTTKLETVLDQASSFTSEYSNPPFLNRRLMEQQKERLTKDLEKLTQQQTEAKIERHRQQLEKDQAEIKKQITNLATILNDNTVINNFNSQKEKNERIVKECKELLSGAHNLQEDCQTLAKFFTKTSELKNTKRKLSSFENKEDFENLKQDLISQCNTSIAGLQTQTGANTSVGGVCIIWDDFVDHLKSILDDARSEIEKLKRDIERTTYDVARKLKRLKLEEKSLQKSIEENMKRAQNEKDPEKKRRFLILVDDDKKKLANNLEEQKKIRIGDNLNIDDPSRGKPDPGNKKDNNALFYGTEGTGKTSIVRKLTYETDCYPLVEVKGSSLSPNKLDADIGIDALGKFIFTLCDIEHTLEDDFGLPRETNGEVRYILFVDEADLVSKDARLGEYTYLVFLKECMEQISKEKQAENL
ncbi:9109_t:CDS:2 [Paraglomus brasilianum]|uniref:9109_t:CDS:1 n=1 Tax=Paraglomus brasilianum TaxID=144538 RepID=A0A9N9G4J0_9GLOM|nr:9109_t:CDS:2 [Paraglomus brasilianum]